jgi:hypothetical protein
VKELTLRSNPYVGLRPFLEGDSLYFFGRGQQVAELLEILHHERFLGVVGSSGSGKSSLVRAGLLPKLLGGFLAQDRDRWRIVRMKPGDAPMGNLASALLTAFDQPSSGEPRAALAQRIREDHTDAVMEWLQARVEPNANVFVLVDQFEEIFAFRGQQDDEAGEVGDAERRAERIRRRAEAADFVDLLLELARRRELPIYVALTMRTDFLGDCDLYYGLPEALNRGRYLVPRLTRQQLREAIDGPAQLLQGRIEPRLLDHLLNELGDRFDRLPVLQHALLRTWDTWRRSGSVGSIDFPHYELAGRLDGALDRDAEHALTALDPVVTSAIFRRLTDTDLRQRRVRSPARMSQLMAVAGVDRGVVEQVVQQFVQDGRSFVYTSEDGRPDDPRVDISHESLIRQWDRLRGWVDAERVSRDTYRDLLARARKRERDAAALLQEPELRAAADWRDQAKPSPAWAERYSDAEGDFTSALTYLDHSVTAQCHRLTETELARRWKIWNAVILCAVIALVAASESSLRSAREPGELTSQPSAARVEPQTLLSAPIGTAHVGDLDWTTDDHRRTLGWDAAQAYCDSLTVGDRSDWRLPTTGELLDIRELGEAAGASSQLKPPFRAGVTASYLWSGELEETGTSALAADFKGGMFVPLPVANTSAAGALCVVSPATGRAENFANRQAGVFDVLRRSLPLGALVLAYLVLAWGGRRLHRRWARPAILERFVAAGGRDPDADAAKNTERQDALTTHRTTYAPTWRRVIGYWIDMALHVVVAFFVLAVVVIVQPAPAVVRLPSGELVEGLWEKSDDKTVTITTADGASRSFSVNRGPRLAIIGGVPVAATLPSGARVEGRSFDKLQVAVTLPSEERIEGTLDELADDHVSLTTAAGAHRTFPLDPNTADVDVAWPPTDAGIVVFLLACLAFGWFYEAAQISSTRQATLGMRAVGIFRTGLHGERLTFARASGWYGYRLLSYLAYLLGFVVQLFTQKRQTFHDWMAGSVVLRKPAAGRQEAK